MTPEEAKKLLEDADIMIRTAFIKSRMENKGEVDWNDIDDAMETVIEAARIVERERCAEIVEGRIRKRKPTHGTCCTCQVCGGSNDDICDCSMNSVLEEIEKKILSPNQDNI